MSAISPTIPSLRDRLITDGVLVPMGAEGLYGKSAVFIEVFDGLDRLITDIGRDEHAERFRFPPAIPRSDMVRTDYLRSFPDLVGAIHSFRGDDHGHADLLRQIEEGRDWSSALEATDLVLLPAACYPLYPMVSGQLPPNGRRFDVLGTCFRQEPSSDPARIRMFHQREFVYVGAPSAAQDFRDHWLALALNLLGGLGIDAKAEVASDPFFGRAGRMLAANQREAALKYEVVAPVTSNEDLTAITSCNCHQDHLTGAFEIRQADGHLAHSACVGFGMERIVLALFAAHGTAVRRWPQAVRRQLWP